jgi:rubredoxin
MREMVWVETATRADWTCSYCAWVFKPLGPPLGKTIEEMKQNYERQAQKEFAAHVCAEYPRNKGKGPGGKT